MRRCRWMLPYGVRNITLVRSATHHKVSGKTMRAVEEKMKRMEAAAVTMGSLRRGCLRAPYTHFYSTIDPSRNPYISLKTNGWCHFYSTMNPGVSGAILALPARPN